MRVSVVIVTKNRVESLKECIKCLLNQTVLPYELIIVDGSDNDATREYVNGLIEGNMRFSLHLCKQDRGGTATARNIGAGIAKGDIILFVDDDVLLYPDYIEKLIRSFNDDIICVGGNLVLPQEESRLRKAAYKIFGIIFLRDSFKPGKATIAGHHSALPNYMSYVDWLGGSQFACRREVFNNFRFDENLERYSNYAYYEDFDFTYTLSKVGKILLNPELKSVHMRSPVRPDPFHTEFVKILNHYYLVKKHGFNKIAFYWSTFGLLLAYTIRLILKPSKKNYMALSGLIAGVKKIVKGDRYEG